MKKLTYPGYVRLVFFVGSISSFGTFFLSRVFKNPTASVWTDLFFGVCGSISLALFIWTLISNYELYPKSLFWFVAGIRIKQVDLSKIVKIKYILMAEQFKIEDETGCSLKVTTRLVGIRELSYILLQYSGRAKLDEKTKAVLQERKRGNIPPIYF